ncbi:MAG: QueT transporter family protein [Oscillospiraceae bacterium]|nr:QueT transporter family protein [Oscillospiraceae bacterium]
MRKKIRALTHSAMLATLYVVLTHMQNFLFPDSTSFAVQFRASEALCVLALFTPAAVPGLSLGCFLYNLSFAGALPLDMLVGTLATFLAVGGMYLTRNWKIRGYPLPAMVLPAVWNALLVGWELAVYIGGGFWLNAFYVAVGELAVLLSLGTALYYCIKSRKLTHLFGEKYD